MLLAINLNHFFVISKVARIIGWESYKWEMLLIEIASVLIFLVLGYFFHGWEREKDSFSFVYSDFI